MELARADGAKDNWIEIATKNIAKLKNFSQYAPENYTNKVILLEAELAVVRNDMQKAKAHFEDAITLSKKHGFIHEEALACEREGLFFLKTESLDAAKISFRNAYHCYEKWGAIALSNALIKNHSDIFDTKEVLALKSDDTINLQIDKDADCSVSVLTEPSSTCHSLKRKRVRFKLEL